MREILFRGKRSGDGKWVEGYYYRHESVKVCFTSDDPHVKHMIAFDGSCDWGFEPPMQAVEVLPDTVGQYTGLKDKNGVRIFEGDIVKCWSEGVCARGTVQQRKDGLWFINPAWQKQIMWGLCPDEYSHTTVEVIGNIHDNPELVKGE